MNTFVQRTGQPPRRHSGLGHLKVSVGGGMAVQSAVAELCSRTSCPICEGYGALGDQPSVTCNPVTAIGLTPGTMVVPLPSTGVKLGGRQRRPG